MMKDMISVIVPVYNTEDYLRQCVQSIINQTYKKLEIILVDDGSTDESGTICDEYADTDERVRVIHKKNGGCVSARKAGAEISKGMYISNVDSDDWLEPNMYEILISKLYQKDIDAIAFGFYKEYEGYSEKRSEMIGEGIYARSQYVDTIKNRDTDLFYSPIVYSPLVCKLFKRDVFLRNQVGLDNRIMMGEDVALVYPILLDCQSIMIEKECFYHYRTRSGSMCRKQVDNEYDNWLLVVKRLCDALSVQSDYCKTFLDRLLNYLYYELLVINPGKVFASCNDSLFLYPEIGDEDKVVLYGKGVYGEGIKKYIERKTKIKIVGWIDKKDVELIDSLEGKYDRIIITITMATSTKDAINVLADRGVKRNKISVIDKAQLKIDYLPEEVKRILFDAGLFYN